MMEEYLEQLRSELKRADHLFFVSLKYTRTVDVIRSVVNRLMNAYDVGIAALLFSVKKKKKIEVPEQPRKKCEVAKKIFPKEAELIKFIDFYLGLRDIFQAKYGKREEYRRHVTMISHVEPGKDVEVNIDLLQEYYEKTKQFEAYVMEKLR